ncbi:MAG: SDR family NAD(P)-dependent oxidoreductase [Parasphingorhabdus sp.]
MNLGARDVAVVTGGASGIGFELSRQLAHLGVSVCLTDIDQEAIDRAVSELTIDDSQVCGFVCDVTNRDKMAALPSKVEQIFGPANLVINNAGIFTEPAPVWEQSASTWDAAIDVNLRGVLNGINAFMPRLLAQDRPGHIVNVASTAGHVVQPMLAPYHATKFAVTAVTESLFLELGAMPNSIGVSLVCPGFTKTSIVDDLIEASEGEIPNGDAVASAVTKSMIDGVDAGANAADVAQQIIEGVVGDKFYIMTHPYSLAYIKHRFDRVLSGKIPVLRANLRRALILNRLNAKEI